MYQKHTMRGRRSVHVYIDVKCFHPDFFKARTLEPELASLFSAIPQTVV